MNQASGLKDPVVMNYLQLRKAVGIIGFVLPLVLVFGNMILEGAGIQPSISSYYYTDLRNVFVGSLCAIGVFLLACKGYDRRDEIAGYLACVFAVGAALFPTTPDAPVTGAGKLIGLVHLTFATLLFLTFVYFCFGLFTSTAGDPTKRKLQRNTVYRVCGMIILGCIAMIAVVKLTTIEKSLAQLRPVLWLEAAAVMTFGVAWLTKGETILRDEQSAAAKDQIVAKGAIGGGR
jgi:hypothetical protein